MNAAAQRPRKHFIRALVDVTQNSKLAPFPVKFFVTSRPEAHIRPTLGRGDPPPSSFFTTSILKRLAAISISTSAMNSPRLLWIRPTSLLARLGTTSLISTWSPASPTGCSSFASTVVKFVLDDGFASARAKRCKMSSIGTHRCMTRRNLSIKSTSSSSRGAVNTMNKSGWADLQLLLGRLLALREPLSTRGFADLSAFPLGRLRSILDKLHAVINVPADNDVGGLRTCTRRLVTSCYSVRPRRCELISSLGREVPSARLLRANARRGSLLQRLTQRIVVSAQS